LVKIEPENYFNWSPDMLSAVTYHPELPNEFDRTLLLGRLLGGIQDILANPELKNVQDKIGSLDTFYNLIKHYGLNTPIEQLKSTIDSLGVMFNKNQKFARECANLPLYKELQKIEKNSSQNYLYKMESKPFLAMVHNFLTLIDKQLTERSKTAGNKNIADDNQQSAMRFALYFLGELFNHIPLNIEQALGKKNADKLILLLKDCKTLRNIKFHEVVKPLSTEEIQILYSSLKDFAVQDENSLQKLTELHNKFTALLDPVSEKTSSQEMTILLGQAPRLLTIIEQGLGLSKPKQKQYQKPSVTELTRSMQQSGVLSSSSTQKPQQQTQQTKQQSQGKKAKYQPL